MGSVSFLLKEPNKKQGKTLILLQFKYNNQKLVYSTKQFIAPENWKKEKQRVKSVNQTTSDGKYKVNDLLKNLEEVVLDAYNTEVKNGIPPKEVLKQYLDNFMNQNMKLDNKPTLFNLLDRFIKNEIKHKGRDKSINTIKTYQTLKGHLIAYKQRYKREVDFEDITLDFYYSYLTFLRTHKFRKVKLGEEKVMQAFALAKGEKGLAQNSISKDIQILILVMGEAVDLGYTNNLSFKNRKFAVNREETHAVYMTKDELHRLYNFDLSHKKDLEQAKDLFVFGSFVGLRFSDYASIKPEYMVNVDGEMFIKMITKKTGDLVIIPCDTIVLEIFEKYSMNENKLPVIPGNTLDSKNTLFNRLIKEACKEAGFNEKGRLATDSGLELWECISSHTARRNFATNLYIDGFPTIDLMKITGHKTEKAFMKYIKLSKLDAAKRLNKHMRLKWSERLLKIEAESLN